DAPRPPRPVRAVVIGGGIVGNSLTGWLAELGAEVVQLDKGAFPNPGGSTGHASNFIFPVDHSKEMTQLTLESMPQYRQAGRSPAPKSGWKSFAGAWRRRKRGASTAAAS